MNASAKAPEPVPHIPWGYGRNRVTAMAVDPERLYAYWEITDLALEAARSELGDDSAGARLVLRIHDVTGRVFDGTNAHGRVDIPIDRADRQWFTDVHRPGSAAVVEVGLAGTGGKYVVLARSRRVEFPRRDPAPWVEPVWAAVRDAATGPAGTPGPRYRLEPMTGSRTPEAPGAPSRGAGTGAAAAAHPVPPAPLSGGSEERLAGGPEAARPGASEGRLGGLPGR